MQSVPDDFEPICFGEQVELLGTEVAMRRNAARVSAVLRFSAPGTALVKVHFKGTEHESRKQEIHCSPDEVGQPLVMSMVVYEGKLEHASAVKLSLDFNGQPIGPRVDPRADVDELPEIDSNLYQVLTRERIEEGLRLSRLPVLRR